MVFAYAGQESVSCITACVDSGCIHPASNYCYYYLSCKQSGFFLMGDTTQTTSSIAIAHLHFHIRLSLSSFVHVLVYLHWSSEDLFIEKWAHLQSADFVGENLVSLFLKLERKKRKQ